MDEAGGVVTVPPLSDVSSDGSFLSEFAYFSGAFVDVSDVGVPSAFIAT